MSGEIPRWMFGDPAKAVEHLQRMRAKQVKTKQQKAVEELEKLFKEKSNEQDKR